MRAYTMSQGGVHLSPWSGLTVPPTRPDEVADVLAGIAHTATTRTQRKRPGRNQTLRRSPRKAEDQQEEGRAGVGLAQRQQPLCRPWLPLRQSTSPQ